MKPRITYGWYYVFIGASYPVEGWYCSGDGKRVFGVTPRHAYDLWVSEAAPVNVGPEQPKSSKWRQFWDFFFAPVDIFARYG